MEPRMVITGSGRVVWKHLPDAYRYAEARHQIFGTRQRIRRFHAGGWHVSKSPRQEVAEPCS